MANVVLTHFSPFFHQGQYQSSVFYDGLIKGFTEEGHNVLQLITSDFLESPWNGSNKPYSKAIKKEILNKIKAFKPDLVISFNNSSIEDIETTVSCPIAIYDADTFQFFNDKDVLKKNADRYHYMAFLDYGISDFKRNLGIDSNRVCRIPGATAVTARDEEKQYNISFIGHPFFKSDKLIKLLNRHPELINISHEEVDNKNSSVEKLLQEYNVKNYELKYHKTGDRRTQLITNLLDLKPRVFGPPDWLRLAALSSDYIEIYDPAVVYTLQHNEDIYNRSKISISTNHTQNTSGYPWRIHDIMASSSVLLSEYRQQLVSDFSDTVNLQLFKSSSEAAELARKLIKDDSLRLEIITQQKEAIDRSFRWKHRFPLIQQLTGVDLCSVPGKIGTYELYRGTFLPIKKPLLKRIKKKFKKLIK